MEWHIEPDFIVKRDETHWHAYWLVDDMAVEDFRERAATANPALRKRSRMCTTFRACMRVPGTLHLKDPAHPRKVTLLQLRDEWEKRRSCRRDPRGVAGNVARAIGDTGEKHAATVLFRSQASTCGCCWATSMQTLPRDQWRDIIAAIRATPITGDEDESERRRIAIEFSRGLLDRSGSRSRMRRRRATRAMRQSTGCLTRCRQEMAASPMARFTTLRGPGDTKGHPPGQARRRLSAPTSRSEQRCPRLRLRPGAFLMTEGDIFAWPDPEELVAGFIMCGENVCLFGQPKVGKTFIALDLALSIAANLPVFGHLPVRKTGAVVYLSGEGHAGMKRRVKGVAAGQRHLRGTRRLPFYLQGSGPEHGGRHGGMPAIHRWHPRSTRRAAGPCRHRHDGAVNVWAE